MQITAENLSSGASTYQWLVNGSSQSTAFEPSFTMASAGVFDIELIATTEFGCADTATISGVESYLVPIANFTVDHTEGCTPLSVSFNNSSYQTLNPSYLWDFGNGETSSVEQATETFYNPQFYSISLTVTNANGCADTLIVPSLVQVFDTSAAPICPILRVTVANTQAVRIEWEESVAEDFGSYLIYRKNAGTGEFDLIQEITDAHTLAYVDEGLNTLDNVYCYKLQTMDRCGYNIAIDSLIEHCSINVEATLRENHTISVDWTPYIGKTPSQYRVYRTEENTSNVEDLGTVAGDVTNFIDSTVFCPLTYRYDIKAEGLNGQWHVESNSDFDISDRLPNLFVDQQVDASRSTVVDNRFVMTEWRRPAVMGNRVSSYHVFRSTDNQLFTKIASLPPEQTFYVDEAVDVDHVKYFYRIMATNSCGIEGKQGGFSDNIVLSADPAGDFYIQLRWTPYTGWGENGVGFYILERETEDGSWEVIHQVPGTVTTAVDEN
jgi:PKD repeat protein